MGIGSEPTQLGAPRKGSRPGLAAFSMVELLIIVGIIAVLLSILLPMASQVRQQARRTACANNLRQLTLACTTYAMGNDGLFPSGVRDGDFYEHLPWISGATHDYFARTANTLALSCPDLPLSSLTGEEMAAVGSYYRAPYGWVIGYNYLAGHTAGHVNGTWAQHPWLSPQRITDGVMLPVWCDFTFLNSVSWAPHGPRGMVYGPAYTNPNRFGCQGSNVAYSDGSVTWRPASESQIYSATPDSGYLATW